MWLDNSPLLSWCGTLVFFSFPLAFSFWHGREVVLVPMNQVLKGDCNKQWWRLGAMLARLSLLEGVACVGVNVAIRIQVKNQEVSPFDRLRLALERTRSMACRRMVHCMTSELPCMWMWYVYSQRRACQTRNGNQLVNVCLFLLLGDGDHFELVAFAWAPSNLVADQLEMVILGQKQEESNSNYALVAIPNWQACLSLIEWYTSNVRSLRKVSMWMGLSQNTDK